MQVNGITKINGVEYKIYSGLDDNKHIENYKIFVMQSVESTSVLTEMKSADASVEKEKTESSETIRKNKEQTYVKKAFVLTERLDELRKFINEKTETDEADEGLTSEENAAKKEKDLKKLQKLLAQIK